MAVPALRHPQFFLPPSRANRDGHALQWYLVAGDAAEAGSVFAETRCCVSFEWQPSNCSWLATLVARRR